MQPGEIYFILQMYICIHSPDEETHQKLHKYLDLSEGIHTQCTRTPACHQLWLGVSATGICRLPCMPDDTSWLVT